MQELCRSDRTYPLSATSRRRPCPARPSFLATQPPAPAAQSTQTRPAAGQKSATSPHKPVLCGHGGGSETSLPKQGRRTTTAQNPAELDGRAQPNRVEAPIRSGSGGVDWLGRRAERAPALSPRQACGTRHLARVPEIKRWVGACADAPHQTSLASPHQTFLTSPHAGLSPGSAAGGTARPPCEGQGAVITARIEPFWEAGLMYILHKRP